MWKNKLFPGGWCWHWKIVFCCCLHFHHIFCPFLYAGIQSVIFFMMVTRRLHRSKKFFNCSFFSSNHAEAATNKKVTPQTVVRNQLDRNIQDPLSVLLVVVTSIVAKGVIVIPLESAARESPLDFGPGPVDTLPAERLVVGPGVIAFFIVDPSDADCAKITEISNENATVVTTAAVCKLTANFILLCSTKKMQTNKKYAARSKLNVFPI